tara:strand:- start:13 stop:660 length:648 start_codon:yes stop_codon:yes gene_type:complete
MALRKIRGKVINQAIGAHTGKDGDLFFDDSTNSFKISDGSTAGGVPLERTSVVNATPTGFSGFSNTAKLQMANAFSAAMVKNSCYLTPADGNAIAATLPAVADSELGDVIYVEYQVVASNGQTMKFGTAGEFFAAKSAVYRTTGATGSAVTAIKSVDVADGTADDFLNMIGLTNGGPGVGSYIKFSFNGTAWWAEARTETSGTGAAANLSVFATS